MRGMSRFWMVASVALLSGAAQAELLYGVSVPGATTSLLSFDSATPGTQTTIGNITGIIAGHTLRGIDFRPSTGQLYAMSTNLGGGTAQLYTIDLTTGAATTVGGAIALTGSTSTRVSLDFNPVVDALRVVTGSGQNYRVNPNTGALIARDTDIVTSGSGATPLISGVAYTNNFAGATQTTLYAYDFLLDNLGTIGGINGVPSPNGGVFSIVGNSGVVTGDAGAGFDISGATGMAYLSVDDFFDSAGVNAEFFSINLVTGALTQIGGDDPFPVLDISVLPVAAVVPAPATALLALAALAGLGARRRHC